MVLGVGIRAFGWCELKSGNADLLGSCGIGWSCQVGGYAVGKGRREGWD